MATQACEPTTDQTVLKPLAVKVPTAVQITGSCRSILYKALKEGELEAIKVGRSTLFLVESLETWVASRPRYKPPAYKPTARPAA